MTTKADQLVDRAANRLHELARRAAADGGVKASLAGPLAEDAELLRGMRPSLIAARLRGRPGDTNGAEPVTQVQPAPAAGSPKPERKREKKKSSGPNTIVVLAGAFVAGILIAKLVDWRGHAHPQL